MLNLPAGLHYLHNGSFDHVASVLVDLVSDVSLLSRFVLLGMSNGHPDLVHAMLETTIESVDVILVELFRVAPRRVGLVQYLQLQQWDQIALHVNVKNVSCLQ